MGAKVNPKNKKNRVFILFFLFDKSWQKVRYGWNKG